MPHYLMPDPIYIYVFGLMSKLLTNGQGDGGLIPLQVIPNTQKMVLDAALLNPLHFQVRVVEEF